MKKDLVQIAKGGTGVDLGAGKMLNKRFFACDHYIAVDIDGEKLGRGIANFPDAEVFLGRIQDFLASLENTKRSKDPRILVCVQTMGTNAHFEHHESLEVVRQMHNSLQPGGGMIFNIGNRGVDLFLVKNALMKELSENFQTIKVREYGAFHEDQHRTSPSMSFGLALLMQLFPPLRTMFGRQVNKLYFCCGGKNLPKLVEVDTT